jgi:hypothetical protein
MQRGDLTFSFRLAASVLLAGPCVPHSSRVRFGVGATRFDKCIEILTLLKGLTSTAPSKDVGL